MLICCKIPDVVTEQQTSRLIAVSNPSRISKARRLPPDKRAASLMAGLLLEYALWHMTGERGLSAQVRETEQGKPVLPDGRGPWFSLSHSGNYALCVVSERPVGADVQKIVSVSSRLVRRVCTEEERTWMESARTEEERRRCFFRLWTLKESYLKAMGEGLRGLERAAFRPLKGGLCGPEGWRFRIFSLPGYEGAVCEALEPDDGRDGDAAPLPQGVRPL